MAADWQTIGVEDGSRGMGSDAISRHREACAKAGVTPDRSAYEEGRQMGLVEFCRPSRAYGYGREGGDYRGVCPAEREADFLEAYHDGRSYYELAQAVAGVEAEISSAEYRLDDLRKDLRKGEARLSDSEITEEQRSRTTKKNRERAKDIGRIEEQQKQLLILLGERREQMRAYVSGSY